MHQKMMGAPGIMVWPMMRVPLLPPPSHNHKRASEQAMQCIKCVPTRPFRSRGRAHGRPAEPGPATACRSDCEHQRQNQRVCELQQSAGNSRGRATGAVDRRAGRGGVLGGAAGPESNERAQQASGSDDTAHGQPEPASIRSSWVDRVAARQTGWGSPARAAERLGVSAAGLAAAKRL